MLSRFAAAVAANDGAGLAALFATDGVYDDGFYRRVRRPRGDRKDASALSRHRNKFSLGLLRRLSDGKTGYARYRFSYASKMTGSEGKPVVFEGTAHFVFRDGQIARYSEVFDRGLALAQQDFAPERIKRVLLKLADKQNAGAGAKDHLARLKRRVNGPRRNQGSDHAHGKPPHLLARTAPLWQ